jgi:hypothetical protein
MTKVKSKPHKVKIDPAIAICREIIDHGDALYFLVYFRTEVFQLRAENVLLKRELRARKRADRRTREVELKLRSGLTITDDGNSIH